MNQRYIAQNQNHTQNFSTNTQSTKESGKHGGSTSHGKSRVAGKSQTYNSSIHNHSVTFSGSTKNGKSQSTKHGATAQRKSSTGFYQNALNNSNHQTIQHNSSKHNERPSSAIHQNHHIGPTVTSGYNTSTHVTVSSQHAHAQHTVDASNDRQNTSIQANYPNSKLQTKQPASKNAMSATQTQGGIKGRNLNPN